MGHYVHPIYPYVYIYEVGILSFFSVLINKVSFRKGISQAPFGDTLLTTSTLPGFVSMRDEYSGSPYIQTLCKCIDSATPGKPIKDVMDAHCEVTGEMRNMHFTTTLSSPDGNGKILVG